MGQGQISGAIAVIRDAQVVGQHGEKVNSKQGPRIVWHFLTKTESKAAVKVVGKAVNRGSGHDMKIPWIYRFGGSRVISKC